VKVWHDRALAIAYGTAIEGWIYLIVHSALTLLERKAALASLSGAVVFVLQRASMFAMLLGLLGFVVFQWRFLKVSEKDKPQPIGQERTGAPSLGLT